MSASEVESTRMAGLHTQTRVLRRLAQTTQDKTAARMGLSPSTVSRFVAEELERFCLLLAAIGLQVADANAVVQDAAESLAIKRLAMKHLQAELAAAESSNPPLTDGGQNA